MLLWQSSSLKQSLFPCYVFFEIGGQRIVKYIFELCEFLEFKSKVYLLNTKYLGICIAAQTCPITNIRFVIHRKQNFNKNYKVPFQNSIKITIVLGLLNFYHD